MSLWNSALEEQIAQALLEIGAVVFTPHDPVTFKSGIKSPVYVDNRQLPYWPHPWRIIIEGFRQLIAAHAIPYDIVAGMETAGIPHSAALSYVLHAPSVFVRKEAKGHGLQNRVEGGEVAGKRVLLVEDLVTTGGSSLFGVGALREADAVIEDCLCITTYGFDEARQRFDEARVTLHPLTPFSTIVAEASKQGRFGAKELTIIEDWMRDPYHWGQA
jgi:orotate phosphoribosyltransferase